jgi:hypothetical protein
MLTYSLHIVFGLLPPCIHGCGHSCFGHSGQHAPGGVTELLQTETMHCEHRRSWYGIATLLFFFNFVLTYLFSVKIRPPFFYFVLTYLFSVKILYYFISFSLNKKSKLTFDAFCTTCTHGRDRVITWWLWTWYWMAILFPSLYTRVWTLMLWTFRTACSRRCDQNASNVSLDF